MSTTINPRLLLVVGPGRSGTSLFSAIGQRLGFHIPQPEVQANDTNPKGFGEPKWAVDFHTALLEQTNVLGSDARPEAWDIATRGTTGAFLDQLVEWLDEQAEHGGDVLVKDPRSLWFLDLWAEAADKVGLHLQYATVLRHPAAVVKSRERAYGSRNPAAGKTAVWLNTMLGTEALTRTASRAFVAYDELMNDWSTAMARLAGQLDLTAMRTVTDAQRTAVEALVDPALQRAFPTWDGLEVPDRPRRLAEETWAVAQSLVDDPHSEPAQEALDRLRADYRALYEEAEAITTSTVLTSGRTEKSEGPRKPGGGRASATDAFTTPLAAGATHEPRLASLLRSMPPGLRDAVPMHVRQRVLGFVRGRPLKRLRTPGRGAAHGPHARYSDAAASWERRRAIAIDALDEADVARFAVPSGPLAWTIGVSGQHRNTVLRALAAVAPADLRVKPAGTGNSMLDGAPPPVADTNRDIARAAAVELAFAHEEPLGRRGYYACRIEFWDRGPNGTLLAPTPNVAAVTATEEPADGARPATLAVAGTDRPTWRDVTFPIDAVFLWVDDRDPEWAAARDRHLENHDLPVHVTARDASRFQDRDELRYALRSVHYYAPWLRHIYLVTAGQRPAWLHDSDRLSVVDHRDIFDADALPTFNSNAIISRLHHIPGLAEHYVLFNDDVFLARPAEPNLFFEANGLARFSSSKSDIHDVPRGDETPLDVARRAVRDALIRDHGIAISSIPAHTPHPQLRSLHHDLEAAYPDWYRTTAFNKFRHPGDLEPLLLHNYVGYAQGRTLHANVKFVYTQTGSAGFKHALDRINQQPGGLDSFCLNDTAQARDRAREDVGPLLGRFMRQRFPDPAPWEHPPPPPS